MRENPVITDWALSKKGKLKGCSAGAGAAAGGAQMLVGGGVTVTVSVIPCLPKRYRARRVPQKSFSGSLSVLRVMGNASCQLTVAQAVSLCAGCGPRRRAGGPSIQQPARKPQAEPTFHRLISLARVHH